MPRGNPDRGYIHAALQCTIVTWDKKPGTMRLIMQKCPVNGTDALHCATHNGVNLGNIEGEMGTCW